MKKNKNINIIITILITLIVLLMMNIKSYAEITETTWTDEPTGYTFILKVSENGQNYTATPTNFSAPTSRQERLDQIASKTRARAKAKEIAEEKKKAYEEKNDKEIDLKKDYKSETTTETTKVGSPNPKAASDKTGIAGGSNVICIDQTGKLAEPDGRNVEGVSGILQRINDVTSSTRIKMEQAIGSPTKVGRRVTATNVDNIPCFGFVNNKTRVVGQKEEILGETYESAAIAYIFSRVKDAQDNGRGIDNVIQGATWKENYFNNPTSYEVSISKPLNQEADIYQEYRKTIEQQKRDNQGKIKLKDSVVDKKVGTNLKDRTQNLRTIQCRICKRLCKCSRKRICRLWWIK